jgi:hypothetical protein
MSVFGTSIAQSVAGLAQAQRTNAQNAKRDRTERAGSKPREADELILDVQTAQSPDAVKSAKGNGDEETNEDRQGHDHYQPVKKQPAPERPRLDLSA